MQTDPVGYEDQVNLYAYVYNDPLNTTDPSGMCPWCLVGFAIGAGIQAYAEFQNGSFNNGFWAGASAIGRIGVSGAVGMAGGGLGTAAAKLTTVTARMVVNTGGSAVIGGVGAAGNQFVNGEEITTEAVIEGAETGAKFGVAGAATGEVVGAVGRAMVAAKSAATPTSTKNLFEHVADATGNTKVNTGQQAGPFTMTVANTASNTINNSAPLVQGNSCTSGTGGCN